MESVYLLVSRTSREIAHPTIAESWRPPGLEALDQARTPRARASYCGDDDVVFNWGVVLLIIEGFLTSPEAPKFDS